MRIAILQFSPTLNAVPANLARADALLLAAAPRLANLDLLVLPELAFTGYNFQSLEEIGGVLEVRGQGASAEWARGTARRLGAVVCVGYAEKGEKGGNQGDEKGTVTPDDHGATKLRPPNYNSLLAVSPAGATLAHYRKTHLYHTDETWAAESPSAWLTVDLPLPSTRPPGSDPPTTTTTKTAFAICMDLNPHHFTAPWSRYELATHARSSRAALLVCSMAWLTPLARVELFGAATRALPDTHTVAYWMERLRPLWERRREEGAGGGGGGGEGGEVVVVLANRSGEEEGGARYAGSSCVVGLGGEGGGVRCWGWMGRGVEGVLVVDTGGEAGWRIDVSASGDGGRGGVDGRG